MDPKFIEYSEGQCRKNNGQTVLSVLARLGDVATAEKICDEIVSMNNQPKEIVEPEVKRILRRGIINGFLVKFGKNYLLSGQNNTIESRRTNYKDIGKRTSQRKSNIKSVGESIDCEFEIATGNIALKSEQIDSAEENAKLVLLNPKEVASAITHDLYNLVQTPSECTEEEYQVIDLEAIIFKNLNNLAKPRDDSTKKE